MRRFLGVVLFEIGILLCLFGFSMCMFPMQEVYYGIGDSWPMLERIALMGLAAISSYCGCRLIFFGLRAFQPTAEQVLASDPRPPIVFLRSFYDDSLTVPLGVKRTLYAPVPNPTAESGLAVALNSIGPVVAIGRPGEILPRLGAARAYVGDSEWKEKIAQWMQVSRFVVMLVHHSTPGTHWELKHAVAHLAPDRLVLYFPSGNAFGADRDARYAACRSNIAGNFPKDLPASLGSAQFIVFDADWSPQRIDEREDLIRRLSGGETPKRRLLKTIRPAVAILFLSLILGFGLEFAYLVYWAIKQIADS